MSLTLMAPCCFETPPIKGSRFIGHAAPVGDAEAASRFIAEIRAGDPSATHHCWAWQIHGDLWRYSDDGEPSGTAGRPILAAIRGRDLVRTAVVVTRYYGGVKLGTGGLIRAYGGAAAGVLESASVIPYEARVRLQLCYAYSDQGAVRSVLRASGLDDQDAAYGAEVNLVLDVLAADADELAARLRDRTGGRVVAQSE